MTTSAYPYDVLRNGGITPDLSAKQIHNFDVGQNLGFRNAWSVLRDRKTRLAADFFLYYALSQDRVLSSQEQIDRDNGFSQFSIRNIETAVGPDTPILLIMLNRRDEAFDWLATEQRRNPLCEVVSHRLALFCYAQAQHFEERQQYDKADKAWRLTIANWTRSLVQDSSWNAWCQRRERVYEIGTTDRQWEDEKEDVRESLLKRLSSDLSDYHSKYKQQGNDERAAVFDELMILQTVEVEGAMLLKDVGGLSVADGITVCGPMLLDQLGLREAISKLTANQYEQIKEFDKVDIVDKLKNWETEGKTEVNREKSMTLRWFFSELGIAAALLRLKRPEEVIARLPTAMTADEKRNPAFTLLPAHGTPAFRIDMACLAIQAHLDVSHGHITATNPDLPSACAAWQEALKRSWRADPELKKETVRKISDLAIGRVSVLGSEPSMGGPTTAVDVLETAIGILEAAYEVIGDRDGGYICRELSDALTGRAFEKHHKHRDYHGACEDQRRAFELNPHDMHKRQLYCEILHVKSDRCADKEEAIRLLELACQVAEAGMKEHSASGDFERVYMWIKGTLYGKREEMDDLYEQLGNVLTKAKSDSPDAGTSSVEMNTEIASLIQSAEQKREKLAFDAAASELQRALELDVNDSCRAWAVAVLAQVYLEWAGLLVVMQRLDDANEKVQTGLVYKANDTKLLQMQRQINEMKDAGSDEQVE